MPSAVAASTTHGEPAALAELARRIVSSGTPGTLSTLFSARGSTYRPLGSMMVSVPGTRAGGVSGGCLEEYVTRVGERATRTSAATILQFSTHAETDENIPVLGCGGSIELLVERLTPAHVSLLEQFTSATQLDEASLHACVVRRDGESVSVSREWLRPDRPCRIADDGELRVMREEAALESKSIHRTLAWDIDVLLHYVRPLTRLVIFGAGDDVKPLCQIGASLGWHVSVADRRARLATSSRFPDAGAVFSGEWDEVVDAITFSPRTAVVLMTHDLDDDARVLALLSERPMAYLGALGPAHRREWLLEQAAMLAARPDECVRAQLRGPIGLDLGEKSPAGIAIAVASEILAHLNGRTPQALDAARRI